jgi:hypothetical protein
LVIASGDDNLPELHRTDNAKSWVFMTNYFPNTLKPGNVLSMRLSIYTTVAVPVYASIQAFKNVGDTSGQIATFSTGTLTTPTASGWTDLAFQITIPSTWPNYGYLIFGFNVASSTGIAIRRAKAYLLTNGSDIVASSITAAQIAANAITAEKVAANAITAEKISVTTLAALTANIGKLLSTSPGSIGTGGAINGTNSIRVDSTTNTIKIGQKFNSGQGSGNESGWSRIDPSGITSFQDNQYVGGAANSARYLTTRLDGSGLYWQQSNNASLDGYNDLNISDITGGAASIIADNTSLSFFKRAGGAGTSSVNFNLAPGKTNLVGSQLIQSTWDTTTFAFGYSITASAVRLGNWVQISIDTVATIPTGDGISLSEVVPAGWRPIIASSLVAMAHDGAGTAQPTAWRISTDGTMRLSNATGSSNRRYIGTCTYAVNSY